MPIPLGIIAAKLVSAAALKYYGCSLGGFIVGRVTGDSDSKEDIEKVKGQLKSSLTKFDISILDTQEKDGWTKYTDLISQLMIANHEASSEGQSITRIERKRFYAHLENLPINEPNLKSIGELFDICSDFIKSKKDLKAHKNHIDGLINRLASSEYSLLVKELNEELDKKKGKEEEVKSREDPIEKYRKNLNEILEKSHASEYKKYIEELFENKKLVSSVTTAANPAERYRYYPNHLKNHFPSAFPNLASWICYYDFCLKMLKDEIYETFPKFDQEEFKTALNEYISRFSPPAELNSQEHYGFIEKRQLENETKIFVRADLHADLESLLANLKALQKEGLLDANYLCKPGVQLVFLGDYVDRGNYSAQVLRLLISLKLSNPDQVILLRGNHENVKINQDEDETDKEYNGEFKSIDFKRFRQNKENKELLDQFYNTLPLAAYIGQKTSDDSCQYSFFTHALFELHIDPMEMLHSPNPNDRMLIPKKIEMSNRMRDVSDRLWDIEARIPEDAEKREKQKDKVRQASTRVNELVTQSLEERKVWPKNFTTYNWGDIAAIGEPTELKRFTKEGIRRWKIDPVDIKHYLRLISDELVKVKMVFRGHQHDIRNVALPDGKVVAYTLSIGMGDAYTYESFEKQPDKAFILTTGEKVRNWTKKALFHHHRSCETIITDEIPVYSSETYKFSPEYVYEEIDPESNKEERSVQI